MLYEYMNVSRDNNIEQYESILPQPVFWKPVSSKLQTLAAIRIKSVNHIQPEIEGIFYTTI
jgi:hypothetical protein